MAKKKRMLTIMIEKKLKTLVQVQFGDRCFTGKIQKNTFQKSKKKEYCRQVKNSQLKK